MTTESLHIIQLLRDYLVADTDIWNTCIAPAYLDRESGAILYKPDNSRIEMEYVNPSDKLGNWFYLRYKEGQAVNHGYGQYIEPAIREFNSIIPMRMVATFTMMDMHEVLDRVINKMLLFPKTFAGHKFNTAYSYDIQIQSSYIDLIGQYPGETDNRFIAYSDSLLTIGIDFNLSYLRNPALCRQFTTKIS
jgi:hypothetical protein